MTTTPPTDRDLLLFRTAGPAAGWSAILGPFAVYYGMLLIPAPWNLVTLLSCFLTGAAGLAAVTVGSRWHRPSAIVAGVLAAFSSLVQLLLIGFLAMALGITSLQH